MIESGKLQSHFYNLYDHTMACGQISMCKFAQKQKYDRKSKREKYRSTQ